MNFQDLRQMRAPLLAWGVLALVSVFLHGPMPLYSTRSLAVAWEMWDRGSWLLPLFNAEPYSHKTPLLQWLVHAGWWVGGVGDAWPRVLAVLLGAIAIVQAGMLARRLHPQRPRMPVYTAWAMAGFWYFFLFGLQVMYELPLTVAVLGGLLALCRREGEAWVPWWPGVALGMGLALLAKGPVALLHLGVPLLAARWWHPAAQRDGLRFARHAGAAVLGGIAMFALWLVPALVHGGPEYREAVLVMQTAGRIRDSFDHAEPLWWYLPVLLALMAPWWWSAWWWRQAPALWRDRDSRLPWAWLLGTVLGFSVISGKLPYYLLPEFAACALLLARAADLRPRLGVAVGVALLVLAVPMLGLAAIAPKLRYPYPEVLLTTVPIAGAAWALIGVAALRRRSLPAQACALLVAVAIAHAAMTPLIASQFNLAPTARLLGEAQRNGTPLAFLGEYQLQFHFDGRLHDPVAILDEGAARRWAEATPQGLIVVNTLEPWTHPGPQPLAQQRFRTRWIQAWRAGEWRRLPAQQLPLQPATGELHPQPH